MSDIDVIRIPVPSEILRGEWYGTVYAIDTTSESLEKHNAIVEKKVGEIKSDFDDNSHYTISLQEVKRENVFADERTGHYCTLVQFRVRDSY